MSARRKRYPTHPMQSVAPPRPPNFVLDLAPNIDQEFKTVYRACDYCNPSPLPPEEEDLLPRHELVRLPNGLLICEQHLRGTVRDKLHDLGRSP